MQSKKQALPFLIALALVLSVVLVKSAYAQWQNPTGLPGQDTINPPLTNPLTANLDLNNNDIVNVDGITAANIDGTQLCIDGDCQSAWPTGDVSNPMTTSLDAGGFRISNIDSCVPGAASICYGLEAMAAKNAISDAISVGVYGHTNNSGANPSYGVYGFADGSASVGLYGNASAGWAAYFNGPFGASGDGQIYGDMDILYDVVAKIGGNLNVDLKVTSDEYCIGASCITAWPSGVGGSGTANYLPRFTAGTTLGNSVVYQNSSKIGVGTTNPNKKFHVYDVSTNAEIDIQSTAAASSWWGIYHNATSDDLVFWKDASDRFTFTDDGKFGVGVVPTVSIQTGGDITATGNVTAAAFLYSSDAKLKDNVKTITNPLAKVKNLRGVTFNWQGSDQPSLGFIAQEVEQVLPELVHENNGQKYLEYGNITAVLVEAIKDQQKQIEQLQEEIKTLKKQ